MWRQFVALAVGFFLSATGAAHFQMLLPAKPAGEREQPVTVRYQWGHPFEHQLFTAPQPEAVLVFGPDRAARRWARCFRKSRFPVKAARM